MANQEHLDRLREGVEKWNQWRQENPEIQPDLRGLKSVGGEDYSCIDLRRAILSSHPLDGTAFWGTILDGADLREAKLHAGAYYGVQFKNVKAEGANLSWADFTNARFDNADLRNCNLDGANCNATFFNGADLTNANLRRARLTSAHLEGATLDGATVWGISTWGITLDEKLSQKALVIDDVQKITVDDIELASFTHLLLTNEKVRKVIDATATKIILILGRFSEERLAVLQSLREQIRKLNYVPMLFDFKKSQHRDLTETVILMASMSRGVIADLTDAKAVPQELSHVVGNLPSVPVQPILAEGKRGFGMFEHWERYPWVLKVMTYPEPVPHNLGETVMRSVENYFQKQQLTKQLQQFSKSLYDVDDEHTIDKVRAQLLSLMSELEKGKG